MFPSTPCGLDKLSDTSWKSFLIKQEELPHCETGHESGDEFLLLTLYIQYIIIIYIVLN